MRRRRILKTKFFSRWALRAGLSDTALLTAADEIAQGLVDADLGGGVIKKRVGVPGRGKSGGARVVLATNLADRWFFMFGFLKNQRPTITPRELEALRELAGDLLGLNERRSMSKRKAVRSRKSSTEPKPAKDSRILDAVHETALDLHAAGFIDKRRMRQYEALCLDPLPVYSSGRIRELRDRHRVSQAVLAAVLNTSLSTVRQWEIGEKRPSGPSVKLLNLLDRKGLEALL